MYRTFLYLLLMLNCVFFRHDFEVAMMTNKDENAAKHPVSNFRSNYYEKVGFRGVDERKALVTLLESDSVNLDKLTTFALKCSSIQSSERLLVWKLLLGELLFSGKK